MTINVQAELVMCCLIEVGSKTFFRALLTVPNLQKREMDRLIERHCGIVLPFLPLTDLKEAQRVAQGQAKFLLVYLHCHDHPDAPTFVSDVLGSLQMTALFRDSLLLFGLHVHDKPGYELALRLECTTYPYVALCLKQEIIFDTQGRVEAAEFVQELRLSMDEWYPVLAKEISIRHEREAAQRLRDREEAELAEAMRIDQERLARFEQEEARRTEEAQARDDAAKAEARAREVAAKETAAAEEAARLAAARAAVEEQRLKDELELRKAVAMSSLPEEPPSTADPNAIATIAVRTFTGKTHERKFFRANRVKDVYLFASSTEAYDGRPFHLAAGFPPKRIDNSSDGEDLRIENVPALIPRAVVVMREERSN